MNTNKDLLHAKALLESYHAARSQWSAQRAGTPSQKGKATRLMNAARDRYDKYMECGKFCTPS